MMMSVKSENVFMRRDLGSYEKLHFVACNAVSGKANHARFSDGFKDSGFCEVYDLPDARVG